MDDTMPPLYEFFFTSPNLLQLMDSSTPAGMAGSGTDH
jgi:hypothetical protein